MLSKRFANIEGHLTQQKKADVGNFVLILGPSTFTKHHFTFIERSEPCIAVFMKEPSDTGDSDRDRTDFNIVFFSCFSIWLNCPLSLISIRCGPTNSLILPVSAAAIISVIRRFPWIKR